MKKMKSEKFHLENLERKCHIFFLLFSPPKMSALTIKPVTWAPHDPRSSLSSVTAYCQPSIRSVRRKDTWDPIPSRRTSRTTLRKHSTQLFPFTSLWPSQSQHNQRLRINNSVFLTVKELAVVCRSLRVPSQACKKGFLHHMGHSCLKIGPSEILKLLSEVHLGRVSLYQCISSSFGGFKMTWHISSEESLSWCCLEQEGDDLPQGPFQPELSHSHMEPICP